MIAPPDPANLGPSNIEIGGAGGGFSEHNNNTPSFTSTNEFRRVVQGFVHLPYARCCVPRTTPTRGESVCSWSSATGSFGGTDTLLNL